MSCDFFFNIDLPCGNQIAASSPTLEVLRDGSREDAAAQTYIQHGECFKSCSKSRNSRAVPFLFSSTVECYRKSFLLAAITLHNGSPLSGLWLPRLFSYNQHLVIYFFIHLFKFNTSLRLQLTTLFIKN